MELVELGVSQFNEGTLRTFEALCLNGIGSGVDLQIIDILSWSASKSVGQLMPLIKV